MLVVAGGVTRPTRFKEAYHQNYLTEHPDSADIVINETRTVRPMEP